MSRIAPFDPEALIQTLDRHKVEYVLIGALAARLYGFPRLTADADITPAESKKNLDRLSAALRELDAKVYTETIPEGLAFDISAATFVRARIWNLVTKAGRLDIAFEPSGTRGYPDLQKDAVEFDAFGVRFFVASLDDIIRSKTAANRPKDRDDVVLLKELRRRSKR